MNKEMECPLCEQKNARFITRDLRFEKNADVYECLQCELVFLDQRWPWSLKEKKLATYQSY